jgi:Protein of unknown function (DUF3551)
MRVIAVVTVLLAALSLCGCGGGRGAPWCAHYSTGLNDCSFQTSQQCTASLSGVGGMCARNPYFAR